MDEEGFTSISKRPGYKEMDRLTKKYLGKNVIIKYSSQGKGIE